MVCSMNIIVAQRKGNSYLKDAYVTQPFRIVPVGQYKRDNAAYLMIMSSSPGLLDKDDHQIKINLQKHTKLQLQTQAYQRLFQMREGSRQTTEIKMDEGTVFSFVPHPVVPQNASSFVSHNVVEMEKNCHFLLSDIITCGRKLTGELFEYNHFQNLTEIYVEGKLAVKDNVLLQPQIMPINQLGILEGYTHQATLIYVNTAGYAIEDWIERFHEKYSIIKDIAFGISKLSLDGFMIRVLGNGAEILFEMFQAIQNDVWEGIMISHTVQIESKEETNSLI